MRPQFTFPVFVAAAILVVPLLGHAARISHQRRPIVVVLDPGHGGQYVGAVSADGSDVEKLLTLRVARQAGRDLRRMGYRVYLTRTRDQAVNTPPRDLNHDGVIDEVDDLNARTIIANRHHADAFISIHFDAGTAQTRGTHGYYCPARPFWRRSRRLSRMVTQAISVSLTRSGYSSPNDGVQTDVADVVPQRWKDYPWFIVLGPSWSHRVHASDMPGALIESLYLGSPSDAEALHRQDTIGAIARGYAAGIRSYFRGRTEL